MLAPLLSPTLTRRHSTATWCSDSRRRCSEHSASAAVLEMISDLECEHRDQLRELGVINGTLPADTAEGPAATAEGPEVPTDD